MSTLSRRVLSRYLFAKGGLSLLPDYKKALEALARGETDPMMGFADRIEGLMFPDGGNRWVAWYHGLGTTKRNAIKSLVMSMRAFYGVGGTLDGEDPENLLLQRWVRDLTAAAKHVHTLELASVAGDEDDTKPVEHAGFTVRAMPGVTRAQAQDALECLGTAMAKLKPIFPEVIYGDVYLSTHLSTKAAAWYVPSEDKFYLSVNARKRFDDVYTIIHELGHRFDQEFWKDKDSRNEFWNLSTRKEYEKIPYTESLRRSVAEELLTITKARKEGRPMPRASNEALLWVSTRYTPGADIRDLTTAYLSDKIDDTKFVDRLMGNEDINVQTEKLLHGPLHVTDYGGKSPKENFAEGFAHYVLGMDLAPELKAIYDKLR